MPFSSTMRAAGWPAASTVASVIALGSCISARRASSNQRSNCAIGSASASSSAGPPRIVAAHRRRVGSMRSSTSAPLLAAPQAVGGSRKGRAQIRLARARAWARLGAVLAHQRRGRNDATQSAATDLGGRRRCGQRLAADPARLCQRDHGRPGLGQPDRRHAARPRRLRQCADHAAGDLVFQRHAARPRALERARHHHEDARCRLLRHHLPDDQHARGGQALRRRLPLSAQGLSQLRADPRHPLCRRRLRAQRERHRDRHGHDRDRAGRAKISMRSSTPPASMASMSAPPTSARASPASRRPTSPSRAWWRCSSRSSPPARSAT